MALPSVAESCFKQISDEKLEILSSSPLFGLSDSVFVFWASDVDTVGSAVTLAKKYNRNYLYIFSDSTISSDIARRSLSLGIVVNIEVFSVSDGKVQSADPINIAGFESCLEEQIAYASQCVEDVKVSYICDVYCDNGLVVVEYKGLEVARVEQGLQQDFVLSVGVGQADREIHSFVDESVVESLQEVCEQVDNYRDFPMKENQSFHPLARLAMPKLFRWYYRKTVYPKASMLSSLANQSAFSDYPVALFNDDPVDSKIIVFVNGINLDLIPIAQDYRLLASPDSELLLVAPVKDSKYIDVEFINSVGNASLVTI